MVRATAGPTRGAASERLRGPPAPSRGKHSATGPSPAEHANAAPGPPPSRGDLLRATAEDVELRQAVAAADVVDRVFEGRPRHLSRLLDPHELAAKPIRLLPLQSVPQVPKKPFQVGVLLAKDDSEVVPLLGDPALMHP